MKPNSIPTPPVGTNKKKKVNTNTSNSNKKKSKKKVQTAYQNAKKAGQ
jgi:hypothetical protein